ncbi:MAG: YibE/F family protein [Vallitalea sp.]|nr:YibE/F family protein [Vallitalea sp.]
MKKYIVLLASIIYFALFSLNIQASEPSPIVEDEADEIVPGKVISIIKDEFETLETSGGDYVQKVQVLKVKLTKGEEKGKLIEVYNTIDGIMANSLELKVGDELYCVIVRDEDGNIVKGYVDKIKREKYLLYLIIAFVLLTIIVGGTKGIKTLITLGITIVGVYYMLNAVIKGQNPVVVSIIISIIVTIITMFIIAGFNRKAISAIIGTMAGVIFAGIISLVIGYYANLSGLDSSEAQMLLYSTETLNLDFKGILFASILLGTLGAVMDVCMSISSSITELKDNNPIMTVKQLFKSGMNIGKDVMGTMSNTLILAYAGTSMCMMLLFMVNNMTLVDVVNMELISTEIVRAMAGTIGLIISIPITAIVASLLAKADYKKM